MLSKASTSSSVRERNSPYPRAGESASRGGVQAARDLPATTSSNRSSEGYVRRSWSDYRNPNEDGRGLNGRTWTYPRGKDLITDEGRREDFFTKNEIFFWKTLLEVFDGKHGLLSTDVIGQVKNKWKNLYDAYKRDKEKKTPEYKLLNISFDDMDLDQLFLKLEEIEDRDDMGIYEPDFTKSGLPEGETLPVVEICHEGLKISSLEIRDETRQQFIDMLYERNDALERKKREKY